MATASPLVVAGPVLRRVDDQGVTVFVVTREPRQVVVEVIPGSGPADAAPLLAGTAATVALGGHAHAVAVTATVTAQGAPLEPGTTYRYRVGFTAAGSARQDLMAAGVAAATPELARELFCYPAPAPQLPSFVTAPATADGLRVLHGGARRPHASGPDMLAHADTVIERSLASADSRRRPHLLLLHGDQITAADVADTTLSMVRSAVATLGIRDDVLPGTAAQQPGALGPGTRAALCESIRLPTPAPNHLLSFAEYAAMQLMMWTDTLWPAEPPAVETVHPDPGWASFPAPLRARILAGKPYQPTAAQRPLADRLAAWRDQTAALRSFRSGLPAVRRVLANVPVLTGLGEHDISPGWNGGTAQSTALLTDTTGRRVVQNALAAHAVLRAWGNTPEQFTGASSPGRLLLDALSGWLRSTARGEDAQSAAIAARAGVPDTTLTRPSGALDYHYLMTGRGWQLLVLDVATRRSLAVVGEDRRPVGDGALDTMLDLLPEARPDTLTLVASAVPLHRVRHSDDRTVATDQTGSWAADSAGYHYALNRLATRRVPAGADRVRRRQLLVLAGGSGHAFADTIRLSAERAYRTPGSPASQPVPGEATIGHLVAGALLGAGPADLALHSAGYTNAEGTSGRRRWVGWDDPAPAVTAGVQLREEGLTPIPWQVTGHPQVGEMDALRRLARRPEWYVDVTPTVSAPGDSESAPRPGTPLPVETVVEDEGIVDEDGNPAVVSRVTAQTFVDSILNHRRYRAAWSPGSQLVGRESLSEVSLTFIPERQVAVQAVHFAIQHLADTTIAPYSAFPVVLDRRQSLYVPGLYASLALRRGDRDPHNGANGVYAGANCTAGTHVRDLQNDLAELGFAIVRGDLAGVFGHHTEWGVREFQTYAQYRTVAHEPEVSNPPARYVARLSAATVADDQWYAGPVSGVVNDQTRWAIALWKRERWRCPVVVEAFVGGTNAAHSHNPAPGMGNIWRHTEPGEISRSIYVTDFTGRHPVPPAHRVPQPGGLPAGAFRIRLAYWMDYHQEYKGVDLNGPGTADNVPYKVDVQFDGGGGTSANSSWHPDSEVLPENLLPASQGTHPTLADLVRAATDDPNDGRLSTFKVIRAVSDVESIGYYDVLNSYDSAFLSGGLFHWTMGPTAVPGENYPVVANAPTPTPAPVDSWGVRRGEMWAFLALLKFRHPATYQKHFGATGINPAQTWGADAIWDETGRVYVSSAQQDTETGSVAVPRTVLEYNRFRGWHWYYRLCMAFRAEDAFRREMWGATRQRVADVLSVSWPQTAQVANADLEDITEPDGTTRRPTIGEVFTSERAIGLIVRWHVNRPAFIVRSTEEGDTDVPRAGKKLQSALQWARAHCGTNADLAQPPAEWSHAEEQWLIAGMMDSVPNNDFGVTVASVNDWPAENSPNHWTLPINQLPLADPPTAPDPRRENSERQLRTDRDSFRFDATDLPWTGTPH
ncbi:peptidoglycan-binding protein [Streptomyces albipurpureus]|uniref:Peptidoglycan-binding protein n=1 Tax=Streptomyces albipurpureus TaxID=2897419 RepID=A0ABT0UXG4_9ACTN|nr:peptidoglycan-binding domain-containing protein [Streptomyces sp. CWNU-1]MCM2393262.1 peptidoglycan-binding protein [Streptomyces sp. CWNU-1]